MKKRYNLHIDLGGLERKEAEILLTLIPETVGFKFLRQQLESELAPVYEYIVGCTDCRNKVTIESKTLLPKERLDQGCICSSCSDDYK